MLQGGMYFMQEEFAVLYNGMPVGKAEVIRQGLYYRISCRYRLDPADICRLIVKWPEGCENLGIPIPDADGFSLVKKIPAKKIPASDLSIRLIPLGEVPTDDPTDIPAQTAVPSEDAPLEKADGALPVPGKDPVEDREPISEKEPFEGLSRLDVAKLEIVEEQAYAVFQPEGSDVQQETDGAVVGAEDIGIDGSLEDLFSEPV